MTTDLTWLKKQLKKIEETNSSFKEEINKIKETDPYICNEFHPWTPLKLVFLNYLLDVCAIVANNNYSKKNYIDVFAGSGLNKIKTKYEDILIGSPFIALLNHNTKFTKFFFCEKEKESFKTLEKRINKLNFKNFSLFNLDCNSCLDKILDEIKKDKFPYNFFFVDPFDLDFSWQSMKKLLNIRSDILLTFMSRASWRAVCTNEVTGHGYKALTTFFGDDSWKQAKCERDILEIYKKNILKERSDAVFYSVHINSVKGFAYNLLFITHKTGTGNPWMKPIINAGHEIEKHSDKAVEISLDIIKKRQNTLF
ncbi:Uncharacterised protein [uncultured archaeon]|nr:Uncharacterised protein [uncultured archaeon]